jgi:hypothetical protein
MSSAPIDTRLDCLVREAVANYGSYTATLEGLGDGRVDRVLEINVDPEDLTHAYTRSPYNKANKIPPGIRIRHFVYMIPVLERHNQEQRMCVGCDGEDLDIAMFFRPSSAASDAVYVAMPSKAFSGAGSQVQYGFRVRNYFEHRNGVLEPRDDLQIGMELTTSSQMKNPRRGVMLITNNQLFSFQLGVMGEKQAGFKMQYKPEMLASTHSMVDECMAQLHTQVFGSIFTAEQKMAKAIAEHFYMSNTRMRTKGGGGATRSGGATRGGASLSHARLSAGEEKSWNLSVSNSVPISKRNRVQLCLMVGDIEQVYTPDLSQSSTPPALPSVLFAPTDEPASSTTGFQDTMQCLERMRRHGAPNVDPGHLAQLSCCQWPVRDGFEALAVGVREHADRDDEEGEELCADFIGLSKRSYTVQVGTLLHVRITNMSLTDKCMIVYPYYCRATSECGTCCFEEQAEDYVTLNAGEAFEMNYPLQKEDGEGMDGWMFKNGEGKTFLTVLFVLPEELLSQRMQQPVPEDRMLLDTPERPRLIEAGVDVPGPELAKENTSGENPEPVNPEPGNPEPEKLEPECCICLESKTVKEMAAFVPCGHCVCCMLCYKKQEKADKDAGKRSKCPKCRVYVRDTMRLYF